MIDAWIIEELLRKEEEDRQKGIQIELPIPFIYEEPPIQKKDNEEEERGVVVLEL